MTISVDIDIDIENVPYQIDYDDAGRVMASNDDIQVAAMGADETDAVNNFRSAVQTLIRHELSAGRALPSGLTSLIRERV